MRKAKDNKKYLENKQPSCCQTARDEGARRPTYNGE